MRKKTGYILLVQKTLPLLGESMQITTNLPEGSTPDDFYNEIDKITIALDKRMAVGQKRFLDAEKKEQMIQEIARNLEKEKNKEPN